MKYTEELATQDSIRITNISLKNYHCSLFSHIQIGQQHLSFSVYVIYSTVFLSKIIFDLDYSTSLTISMQYINLTLIGRSLIEKCW